MKKISTLNITSSSWSAIFEVDENPYIFIAETEVGEIKGKLGVIWSVAFYLLKGDDYESGRVITKKAITIFKHVEACLKMFIAEIKPVVTDIICAITIIARAYISPASPTTQPSRIYIITPRMVNIDGVNTPAKAPNFFACAI